MVKSTRLRIREYHADSTNPADLFTLVGNAVLTNTTYPGCFYGHSDGTNGFSFFHFNSKLCFDIDQLKAVEYLARLDNWNADARAYLGVGSAYNADPALVAQRAWFELGGTAVASRYPIVVRTDDATNDRSQTSRFRLAEDVWTRFRLDFATGIQTIAPPGKSKGGKASVRYSVTDDMSLGAQRNEPITQHLDMSNYSGGLQLYFGVRQASGTQTNAAVIVKNISVEYEEAA